jgi:hypothetical protein
LVERNIEGRSSTLISVLCTLAFVVCTLLTVAPLGRIPDRAIRLQTPLGTYLAGVGAWLPNTVSLTANHTASQASTNYLEFLMLIGLAFVIYGWFALFILRLAPANKHRQMLQLIWAGALVAGLVYVFTPAMLSHDVLVYASYSRILSVYHANPYFVPLAAYPKDPLYHLNYWARTIAAYGPVWLDTCAFWGLIVGPQPLAYVLAFRLFALACHLINIWLVITILRTMEHSPRTITLGALLYAWNPLVLLESSLGGHNDVFMVTFILSGILLAIRADRKESLTTPQGYLPPIIAFTLAALIKFTALPLITLFLIFLAFRVLRLSESSGQLGWRASSQRWKQALSTILLASIIAGIVALSLYAPFWIGHSLYAIESSFTSPPSALYAENSIMRAISTWEQSHSALSNTLVSILVNRKTWDHISILVLAISILAGALAMRKAPTIRNFVLASVASLGALLIVTPWFYSWYVTWLVGLIAVCLPLKGSRTGRAMLAFVLVFSASALLTYLFKDGYPPFGIWTGLVFLTTIAPPIVAFLIVYFTWKSPSRASYPTRDSAYTEKVRA